MMSNGDIVYSLNEMSDHWHRLLVPEYVTSLPALYGSKVTDNRHKDCYLVLAGGD